MMDSILAVCWGVLCAGLGILMIASVLDERRSDDKPSE